MNPENIATEVYLLDALIAHADAVLKQLLFRGKKDLAAKMHASLQPLVGFRQHVDAETRSGIVIAAPGAIPR